MLRRRCSCLGYLIVTVALAATGLGASALGASGLGAQSTVGAGAPGKGARQAKAPPLVETAHIVIVGGPHNGTYDAIGTRGGCSMGANGPGSFGNQLSATGGDPTSFNSLQLIVPNAKAAAAGTTEFQLIIGFGPPATRSGLLTVSTLPSGKTSGNISGSGTVRVQDNGATAQVTINAATQDGVKIAALIDCKRVTRK